MWSRIHLIPVLQAEEDRDLVRRHLADKAREKGLLGAETKVYNNDRYAAHANIEIVRASLTYVVVSSDPHTQSRQEPPRNRRTLYHRIRSSIHVHTKAFKAFPSSEGQERCDETVLLRLHVQYLSIGYSRQCRISNKTKPPSSC